MRFPLAALLVLACACGPSLAIGEADEAADVGTAADSGAAEAPELDAPELHEAAVDVGATETAPALDAGAHDVPAIPLDAGHETPPKCTGGEGGPCCNGQANDSCAATLRCVDFGRGGVCASQAAIACGAPYATCCDVAKHPYVAGACAKGLTCQVFGANAGKCTP